MDHACTPIQPFGCVIRAPTPHTLLETLDASALRTLLRRHRLLLLRGFHSPDTAAALADYGERWGPIAVWPFGKVLELVQHESPDDHVFDHSAMPLHWDGMYRPQVPELQILQCLQAPPPSAGGRTLFSHSARALQEAAPAIRRLWEGATGRYVRRSVHYDSHTEAPLVTLHPTEGHGVIRYCEPDPAEAGYLNPSEIGFVGLEGEAAARLHGTLAAALRAPSCLLAHAWQAGDVVIADNHTLLHGREAFTAGAPRHLRRVHVLGRPPLDNPYLVRAS